VTKPTTDPLQQWLDTVDIEQLAKDVQKTVAEAIKKLHAERSIERNWLDVPLRCD